MNLRHTRKALLLMLAVPLLLNAKKFYDDDPLEKMPPPEHVSDIKVRELSDYYDFFLQTFSKPGEKQPKKADKEGTFKYLPAQGVNTLGEVPDSSWFTNRIGTRAMSVEEVARGPRAGNVPAARGSWTVVAAKTAGVTPGFNIEDPTGRKYLLKFDPFTNPEMTTGADAVGSLFFHALGYNVPENYLVLFDEEQLVMGRGINFRDRKGEYRFMTTADVSEILRAVPHDQQGRVRAVASHFLTGKPIGEFRYHNTRPDDPNDIYLHERRRDLRGLFVFCAWLGHDDSRAINALDMLVEEDGRKYVKHHLIDFGSILGSASIYPNSSRSGNEYLFEFKPVAVQVATLGLYIPKWTRLKYKNHPSVGLFDHRVFEPEKWKPEYRNPAFQNRLPDDTYWAAKKVMAFTNEQIAAIVKEGKYRDPEAEAWVVECLIERRDIIGRTYFAKVLPLDHFVVANDRLTFEDLAVKYGFEQAREFQVEWSRFDNDAETHAAIDGATGFALPDGVRGAGVGEYFAAQIKGADPAKTVSVYLRRLDAGWKVVGIDRTW